MAHPKGNLKAMSRGTQMAADPSVFQQPRTSAQPVGACRVAVRVSPPPFQGSAIPVPAKVHCVTGGPALDWARALFPPSAR